MNQKEKKIMGMTSLAHSLVHLYEGVLPPLIPLLLTEFSTDYFHLGIVVSVFSYAFGLGSLPAGILADKIGPRRLVTAYLFGAGLFATCIWPVGSLWTYGILMGLIGMCCSTYHPASNTLISLSVREKGKGFGIHGIAGSLGVAAAPLLSAWIGALMGWRAPHVFYGLLGIGIGFFSLTIPRPERPQKISGPLADAGRTSGRASIPQLVLFFLTAIALGLTYKGIMTFLPVYLGERVQLDFLEMNTVALGGTIATVALMSGALGQYVAGRLVDSYRAETLYVIAIFIGTLFVFLMALGANLVIVVAAVVYAFFYFATQPIQNYLISRYIPQQHHGLGYGIHFFLTFGIGSTAAAVCGYLADRFGLTAVFYGMGLCFVIALVLASVLACWTRSVAPHPLPARSVN